MESPKDSGSGKLFEATNKPTLNVVQNISTWDKTQFQHSEHGDSIGFTSEYCKALFS